MKIEELEEYLFINSNQYFLGYENIEVKREVLNGLIKRALMYYGNARPKTYRKYGYEVKKEKTPFKEIDGRPVVNIIGIYMTDPVFFNNKVDFFWNYDYRMHILWSKFTGVFNIDFLVKPILEDITYDDFEFLDMMLGQYLMFVGEARKAFILDGLPFSNDASELFDMGKEIFENARERLDEENNSWHLAVSALI